ncbi:GNAT family N-acetyltransferase [Arthrobacter burdickii]|uniref:GNAT family N-acetyltransferase n=1 Tax=Arthrobacter burdickii TaxID=3035920 RepID=A0ABT8K430_9MICC|nr:GNAT family N-acetyltransferase [Arthrobacter burdickii]MDN4611797.1 GNAT family N-acetyltransferase [Arthrobacter burdickii]
MTDEIEVRQCVNGDLAALEATEPPRSGIARNLLQHQASGAIVYAAAWQTQQLVGTVVLDLVSNHTPELKHLFVQESARGAGVGTALCAWTEKRAVQAGFDKLYLSVGVENQAASRLYERLGFTSFGKTTTTTYQYVDDDGQKQWATETDDLFEKALAG